MGRLIDADDLIGVIQYNTNYKPNKSAIMADELIRYINSQPTAYDVDKVVEQLKEAKEKSTEENKNISEEAKAWNEALNEAIFFVKGGGQGE